MGSLTYDGVEILLDDRVLAHIQIVIVQKLRRGESFVMSWVDEPKGATGRLSVWLNPAIPLYFKFLGSRLPEINAEWLAELSRSANSSQGLIITSERPSGTAAERLAALPVSQL